MSAVAVSPEVMREEIRRAIKSMVPRRVESLNRCAKIYGKDKATLKSLYLAGRITGRIVPGRGGVQGGERVELHLFTPSIDAFFGAVTP